MIYTNNTGPHSWANHIIKYFEGKTDGKIIDQIIAAFRINGKNVEICRTTHDKTHQDLIRCTKIPPNAEICYLDDTFYPEMANDNIYYINVKPYYYSNVVLYDTLKENYLDGVRNNNLSHFTNKHTAPINCNCAVDSSQVVYSRKDFVKDNLLYPFPQTKSLDAYIYQRMFNSWGPAYYSGLISQVKCWNADNLGARPGEHDFITKDMI
jgi:hypothetical protein